MSRIVVGILFLLIAYASSQEELICCRADNISQPTSVLIFNAINDLKRQIEELSLNLTAKINAIEMSLNKCGSNPCQNGATCYDEMNSYSCDCISGYTGKNCDIILGKCASNPCQNGATCNDEMDNYNCDCVSGYTGKNCDVEINVCASNPCQNGATCNDELNNYNCDCVSGYTGRNCDIDIDECGSNPCQNGATCNDELNNYNCSCVSGYTGKSCDIALSLNAIASNGYYYWVTTNTQNWQNSRNECQSQGGDLASVGVKTTTERRIIKQSLSTKPDLVWLGGDDLQVEGTFRWLDGTLVGSGNWDSGQPNGGTDQNYLCWLESDQSCSVSRHNYSKSWSRMFEVLVLSRRSKVPESKLVSATFKVYFKIK